MVPGEKHNVVNSCLSNSHKVHLGFSQVINGEPQIVDGITKIQVDALGEGGFSSKLLWDPINNKINLTNTKVNECIEISLILTPNSEPPFSFTVYLETNGHKIGLPITKTLNSLSSADFSFKFSINQEMVSNGVDIIIDPEKPCVLSDSRLVIQNFTFF